MRFFSYLFITLAIISHIANASYIVLGGGSNTVPSGYYTKVVELGGGNSSTVGIVMASDDYSVCGDDTWIKYRDYFLAAGAREVNCVNITYPVKSNNENPTVIAEMKKNNVFYFLGGDQAYYVETFYHNPYTARNASTALRTLFQMHVDALNAGTPFVLAGSSAGTACQTNRVMISSGVAYDAVTLGAFPYNQSLDYGILQYDALGGIGSLIPNYYVDTHFSERGRQARLIKLISETKSLAKGSNVGIGVDEDTSLILNLTGTESSYSTIGTVFGYGGVWLFDLSASSVVTSYNNTKSIKNALATYLTDGDSFDLATFPNKDSITFASFKTKLNGNSSTVYSSSDIFNSPSLNADVPNQFPLVSASLFNSSASQVNSTAYETYPFTVTINLSKGPNAVGYAGVRASDKVTLVSVHDVRVSILLSEGSSQTINASSSFAPSSLLIIFGLVFALLF